MNHLVGLTKEEKMNRRMNYIEMTCFDNAQQEFEEVVKYAKKETLAYYSAEIISGWNVGGIDCSMFELMEEEQDDLFNGSAAFMTWINKLAAQIHDH